MAENHSPDPGSAPTREWIYGRNSVIFDVETTGCMFGGPNRLRHTVGVAWCSMTGCAHTYAENELGFLAILLDTADVIIAHNSAFDTGVMALYFDTARVDAWRSRVMDPFEIIRVNEGTWAGLGAICEVNNRPTKNGSGLEAITLWNEQQLDKLYRYCATDVLILVTLLEIGGDGDDFFWFCQKRKNWETDLQDHTRVGRFNKRKLQIEMDKLGSYPPNFDKDTCPCAKKAKEVLARRHQTAEDAAVATALALLPADVFGEDIAKCEHTARADFNSRVRAEAELELAKSKQRKERTKAKFELDTMEILRIQMAMEKDATHPLPFFVGQEHNRRQEARRSLK
jgi:hypothetical protein